MHKTYQSFVSHEDFIFTDIISAYSFVFTVCKQESPQDKRKKETCPQ